MKKNIILTLLLAVAVLTITSCQPKAQLPAQFTPVDEQAEIYPDYKDIIIPPNIAPLNFIVRDSTATAFVAQFQGKGDQVLAAGGQDGTIQIDSTQWRQLLRESKGSDIKVTVYAQHDDRWIQYRSHTLSVAQEDIDPYLSYRLIEPGYELYRQIGLYQRNLTNWDVRTIYENNREYDDSENHCVNCHNYKLNSTQSMLFHVRANHGGTIIVQDGQAQKVQLKDSTILTAGVYPSWHPTKNYIAFSTNKTGQTFHMYSAEKIEVMDEASDLILYDVSKNEVSHILRTKDDMETFPCWAPDGRKLYYCSCHVAPLLDHSAPDSTIALQLVLKYDSVKYNLMSIDFDPDTKQWGQPQLVVDAVSKGKSVSVPRVSPDGRYILYTQGDYGQFHIWHKSSDLWVKDLRTDSCYALKEANSPDIDSFHSWSSNSRWFVFSSRRMDGNYTRPFIAYFDKHGHAHKAFVLPQEDPEMNILLLKSYNVPELTKDAVRISAEALSKCIHQGDGKNAKYVK